MYFTLKCCGSGSFCGSSWSAFSKIVHKADPDLDPYLLKTKLFLLMYNGKLLHLEKQYNDVDRIVSA